MNTTQPPSRAPGGAQSAAAAAPPAGEAAPEESSSREAAHPHTPARQESAAAAPPPAGEAAAPGESSGGEAVHPHTPARQESPTAAPPPAGEAAAPGESSGGEAAHPHTPARQESPTAAPLPAGEAAALPGFFPAGWDAASTAWLQEAAQAEAAGFRAGFACLCGRPNVGKSTLLNRMLGEKVSIATRRPQTTRQPIRGVWNGEQVQIVFVDTPGVHLEGRLLNRRLGGYVRQSLREADLVLCVVEPTRGPGPEQEAAFAWAKASRRPVWAVVNKIDAATEAQVLGCMQALAEQQGFTEIFPVSAHTGRGVAHLLDHIARHMPAAPPYFPPHQRTDQPLELQIAERIREALFHRLRQEAPYSTSVQVYSLSRRKGRIHIAARIHVERSSQRALVIGLHGRMLKAIGSQARTTIQALLGRPVHLELQVRTLPHWSRSPHHLDALGLPETL